MNYASGGDFRRALETRLRTLSLRDHTPLVRLRKMVAFDRFLARLITSQPEGTRLHLHRTQCGAMQVSPVSER